MGTVVIWSAFTLFYHQISGAYLVLKEWVFPRRAWRKNVELERMRLSGYKEAPM